MELSQPVKRILLITIIGSILTALAFSLDQFIFGQITKLHTPFLDVPATLITNFFLIAVLLVVIPFIVLVRQKKVHASIILLMSYVTGIVVSFILKLIIAQPRPLETTLYPIINIASYSFPSMHATAVFAVLPLLVSQFPRARTYIISFAVLVILTRLYFQVHYLSDIIAGATLGLLIGLSILYHKRTE